MDVAVVESLAGGINDKCGMDSLMDDVVFDEYVDGLNLRRFSMMMVQD